MSFAAGETSKTITVNVAGDATVEPNENFTVTLSNPSAGTAIGTAAATSTILNDDSSRTPTLVTAVNVGGGQVTASNGVVFQADAGPTTGGAASQVFSTSAGIAGTTDDALFQDERWTPGGSYTYEIAVANGTYQVDLLLAEIYSGIFGPGQRVFDMSLEGQALAALQNIDVYAQVGANAAYTITQQVTVNDGSLSIQVGPGSSSPGNVENAKLNAFAVYSTSGPPPSPTLSIAIGTAATGTILNDDSGGGTASARLMITPGTGLNASTFAEPAYELTNTGTTAIRTLNIDLHNSLIVGTVFDPFGTFGDTTALDFTPYGSVPVSATWAYGPNPVTEGGYKTLAVTFGGAGLAAGQTFAFRLDADPASIEGPAPGPNESGGISGFEHIGASVTVGLVDGSSVGGEVFTQGSAGGGMATLASSLSAAPVLSMSTVGGTPLVTDSVGGILKANLPGLNDLAGSPGNDVVVNVTGTAGQTVRLAVSEIGGVGMDIPLGSHEGNTVLQNPTFVDVTLGAGGTATVALALPAETPTCSLASGSVSGRFAVTAAAIDPATGAAISQVSSTLVVKDAPNSFTAEAASDTFIFQQGFAATDILQFAATGANHDLIGLDQDLFPGMTIQQFLNSNAVHARRRRRQCRYRAGVRRPDPSARQLRATDRRPVARPSGGFLLRLSPSGGGRASVVQGKGAAWRRQALFSCGGRVRRSLAKSREALAGARTRDGSRAAGWSSAWTRYREASAIMVSKRLNSSPE